MSPKTSKRPPMSKLQGLGFMKPWKNTFIENFIKISLTSRSFALLERMYFPTTLGRLSSKKK
jgi:hypothetical protein